MDFDESVRIRCRPEDVMALVSDIQRWAVGPGSPVAAMDKLPPGSDTGGHLLARGGPPRAAGPDDCVE